LFRFDPYAAEVNANLFPFYQSLRDDNSCYFSEDGVKLIEQYGKAGFSEMMQYFISESNFPWIQT